MKGSLEVARGDRSTTIDLASCKSYYIRNRTKYFIFEMGNVVPYQPCKAKAKCLRNRSMVKKKITLCLFACTCHPVNARRS